MTKTLRKKTLTKTYLSDDNDSYDDKHKKNDDDFKQPNTDDEEDDDELKYEFNPKTKGMLCKKKSNKIN